MSAKRAIRTILSFVGPLLVTLFLLEATLRVYQKVARDVPLTSWLPHYRESRFQLSPFLVFGPRLEWQSSGKRMPELAYWNRQGFRTTEEVRPKSPGEFRIIAVGGSTTENVWNQAGIHWPLVLECSLRDQGFSGVRVLNAAMSAYTTAHSLIRLEFDLLEYEPDLLVVMHNINDLVVVYSAHRLGEPVDGHYRVRYADDRYTGEIGNEDVVWSRLWWGVKSRWVDFTRRPLDPLEGYDAEGGERVFRRNLNTIAILAGARGIPVTYLTMPFTVEGLESQRGLGLTALGLTDLPDETLFQADMERFNAAILDAGSRSGAVDVVDMSMLMGSDRENFVDVVHYSEQGILQFGRRLAEELAPKLPQVSKGQVAPPSDAARRRCAWFNAE